MQLASGNPDLATHPELTTIRELRAGVAHQDGTVQPFKEPSGGGVVLGQDRLGVVRAILADMRNRLIHAIHQLCRDDHVQELAPEIIGLRLHRARDLQQFAFGPHFDPRLQQVLDQHRPVLGVELPVDQQALG